MAEITKKESPRNPGIITEQPGKFPKKNRFIPDMRLLGVFGCFMLGIGLAIISKDLSQLYQQKQRLEMARHQLEEKLHTWEQITITHPDYRDGYFTVAELAYQLGDIKTAKQYLEKTLALDPNFKEAQSLEKIVEIRKIGE